MQNDLAQILIPEKEIKAKIQELGAAISQDYAGRDLHLVGVLKGVTLFMADLMRAISIPHSVDFMAISSYEGKESTVRIIKDLEEPITGRDVLLVEDIVDTGLTLHYLLRLLEEREPAALEVCALFNKPARRLVDINLAYKGFDLPDAFVVGYGLDYRGQYRNLPFVAILKSKVYRGEGNL